MYRVILVPVDGSDFAERALPPALLIAHLANARVVLLQVIPRGGDNSDSASDEVEAIRGGEAYLQELAKRGANGLDVETVVLVGEPTLTILEEAKRRNADLIVMSTHGRSGLGRWIYGSVADGVMRHAPVPVILVPATRYASPRPEHPPRILVPLDGSSLAEEVLRPVEELAEAMQADLVLARVVEPRPATYTDLESLASDPTAELAAARSYLEKVAAGLHPRRGEVILREDYGSAVTTISELAKEQDVAAIAMATHGHGGLTRLVLGSVGTGVVQRSNVPVFLIQPTARGHGRVSTMTAVETASPAASAAHSAEIATAASRGDPVAVAEVVAALHGEPLVAREAAARTLGEIGGDTAIAALVGALGAEHDVLARTITHSLVRIGPAAVPALIEALSAPDAFVRWHAARALADIGDQRAIDPLLHALEDPDATVRWEAARGIVRTGKPAVIALLRVLETRPLSPWLAQGAERILHDVPLRSETLHLQPLASALQHSTASLEVPLRAAEVLHEIEAIK